MLKDVAHVSLGPEIRRGLADLDGKGEVAGGIVVVRFGENVLKVIDRVKEKIRRDIEPGLPKGVKIVTTYDRTDLIQRSIGTLKDAIIKLSLTVMAVCIVFLLHLPSAFVAILIFPIAILISFLCMYYLGVTSNIMSLGGIAIAIGEMVDASIVMVENAHKKLEEWEAGGRQGNRVDVIIEAAKEVGPSLFFSLLVITVAFFPVFALQSQAGKLFRPLAYTKTFAILFSSFLAITLTPALMTLFIRGRIKPEEENPISLFLRRIYEPVVSFSLRFKKGVIVAAVDPDGTHGLSHRQTGLRIHAPPVRGVALLYAGDRSGRIHFRSLKNSSNPGQDPDEDSGSGSGLWKGGPGGDRHGPRPPGNV